MTRTAAASLRATLAAAVAIAIGAPGVSARLRRVPRIDMTDTLRFTVRP